jgi:hypothetical protein
MFLTAANAEDAAGGFTIPTSRDVASSAEEDTERGQEGGGIGEWRRGAGGGGIGGWRTGRRSLRVWEHGAGGAKGHSLTWHSRPVGGCAV